LFTNFLLLKSLQIIIIIIAIMANHHYYRHTCCNVYCNWNGNIFV